MEFSFKWLFLTILATALVSLAFVGIVKISKYYSVHSEITGRIRCLEYEAEGVIKKGSCDCAEKIYKSWSETYDLIDACAIVESMKK